MAMAAIATASARIGEGEDLMRRGIDQPRQCARRRLRRGARPDLR